MRAQAAVTAAALVIPAFCWRLTALYMAIPKVSTMTASSMAKACDGLWPVSNVAAPVTESTIRVFVVPTKSTIATYSYFEDAGTRAGDVKISANTWARAAVLKV
jgi:type IV secretory pathway protease TraF